MSLGSQSAPGLHLRAGHPHSWASLSPPHLWGLWGCAKERALRRPGLFLPGSPHQVGQQPREEQRKHPGFRNLIKSSCNTHGRWPHCCCLCFWKSLLTHLLIPKYTRFITEWRIPDSLTQQKAAEKQNHTFLEELSIPESYMTFINPYPASVPWMAEREKKHLRSYGAKPSYTRLMPAKMFPHLKGGLRSLCLLDRVFNLAVPVMLPAYFILK